MAIDSIPSAEWRQFLTSFNRAHQGWLITVDAGHRGGGFARVIHGVPLVGVFDEPGRMVIAAGRERQRMERVLERPVALRCAHTADGIDVGLEIETDAGECVHLRFRSTVPTELVDGV